MPIKPNSNYLELLPAVLRLILEEYAKASPEQRQVPELRNPDIDFSQVKAEN